eukprot:6781-Heterococcus_DN1.PRE.1
MAIYGYIVNEMMRQSQRWKYRSILRRHSCETAAKCQDFVVSAHQAHSICALRYRHNAVVG